MVYRNLIGKQIGLLGSEKICLDIQEFLSELEYKKVKFRETLIENDLDGFDDCDVLIVGTEHSDPIFRSTEKCSVPIMTLTDLFEMVDELETFNIDKMYGNRTVCAYGQKENIATLISMNPNLKIDYKIEESEEGGLSELTASLDKIKNMPSLFFIIADPVGAGIKKAFSDMGYEFGKDFHFFNPRIPKHPTSYYLKKTMMDQPKYTIPCDYTKKALSIKAHGNVMACCSSVGLALGNYLYTSIEEILKGVQAQLVSLSVNNRTYSFCGNMCFMFRENKYCLKNEDEIQRNPRQNNAIKEIKDFNVQLGYDRSCNLACPSCRDHRITKPEDETEMVEMMHEEVKRMCMKKPRNLRIGNGELFFSPYYKDIIFNQYQNEEIALISNGMLFTPENWSHLESKYKRISLEVSIDAIDPDTYKKLRGGDLLRLRKNMEFAGSLRKEGRLKKFSISFVVQEENFREMIGFVEYGKSIHADFIHFMKLNSWGHIPDEKFIQMDVYDERNEHHEEFVKILNDPIFLTPFVHVDNIGNFVEGRKK